MMDNGTAMDNNMNHSTTPSPMNIRRVSILALTTCVGLLAGISSAADSTPSAKTVSASSSSDLAVASSSRLIVRVNDAAAFKELVASISVQHPGVVLGKTIGNNGTVFTVETLSMATALKVQRLLASDESVRAISIDQPLDHFRSLTNSDIQIVGRSQNIGIGIRPVPGSQQTPRGGSGDPQFSNQWHFTNPSAIYPNRDNNITDDIYDTIGLTGAGIVVGVPAPGLNVHLDVTHRDLSPNYSPALSMIFDPVILGNSRNMTGWAGLTAATRNNSVAGQGVAPGATLSTFRWSTGIPLIEFEAYEWLNQDVDIKFYQNFIEYVTPQGAYNNGHVDDYVMDPLQNSIRFGRGGKGVVNVYGTGTGFRWEPNPFGFLNILLPDPYNFPTALATFSPIDELSARLNRVALGVTNGYTNGVLTAPADNTYEVVPAYYVTGNANNYPPALDRRSMIINTIAEDGHYDIYASQGTSVFASVYGGTNNIERATSNIPQSVLTTSPGTLGDPPSNNFGDIPVDVLNAVSSATTSGPAIASGIVALMLEANPRLSVRDIQHIFFESIQDSTRAPEIKWPNFDTTRSYYAPNTGADRSFWETNSGLYNSATTTNQAIRHSDNYGFGMIDTELAVQKALTWAGTPALQLLDTGVVGDIGDGGEDLSGRVPAEVPDAEWVEFLAVDGSLGNPAGTGFSGMDVFGTGFNFCVRQNISIEAMIVDLTIQGEGSNDLYITLTSPTGTVSVLAMPQTLNAIGSADPDIFIDDEIDQAFSSGFINGDEYAYYQHPFLTWKHWGEKAGGVWSLTVRDYGPDVITPEGAETGDDPKTDPGADMITNLGEIGVPGSEFRSVKTLTAFRIRIYGTDIGLPIFDGCNPFTTSCPADLNGDGIINVSDLQIYINWWTEGNALADLDGDGDVDFSDLVLYRGIWIPGFCDAGGDPFVGGRPRPGDGGIGSDNDPVVNPI